MNLAPDARSIRVRGRQIEYVRAGNGQADKPTLVFLHEGLGSLALWKDFPALLSQSTGLPMLSYSRYGYGASDVLREPRTPDYMHVEALDVLPRLLHQLEIENPLLVGHSDGASIAVIYAGAGAGPVCGLVLEAPHVYVEDVTVESIAMSRETYAHSGLEKKLARYHTDANATFRGWNDIWLDPAFRSWNIEQYLAGIACPALAIQGEDDEFGTMAQLDAIEKRANGKVELLRLPACAHAPHRDQRDATLAAMTRFILSNT
jgi:pimeloyl-ACP methyl ester carboxylesterase